MQLSYKNHLIILLATLFFNSSPSFAQFNQHFAGTYERTSTYGSIDTLVQISACMTYTSLDYISPFPAQDYVANIYIDSLNNTLSLSAGEGCSYGASGSGTFSSDYDTIRITWGIYLQGSLSYGPYYDTYIRIPTGIKNIVHISNLTIWPNPATNQLHYTINYTTPEVNICIYNSIGDCVYKEIMKNRNELSDINIEGLAKGLYILQLSGKDYINTVKFIKE